MTDEIIFIDTNILVYAHDQNAGSRHDVAKSLVKHLWQRSVMPILSIQVLQELYVNLVRKHVSASTSKQIIEDYLEWTVVNNDRVVLKEGITLKERYKLSLWDGLILAAAKRADATALWSEDLSAGHRYEGIEVVNPLIQRQH